MGNHDPVIAENNHITKIQYITDLIDYKSKGKLYTTNKRLDLNVGDEVILSNHTFIVQSIASIYKGHTMPDMSQAATEKNKKHANKRIQIETWTYKISKAGEGKNLSRYDLSNKKHYNLK